MKRPTQMKISEVVVPVKYINEPVMRFYNCAQCGTEVPLPPGQERVCSTCGSKWLTYSNAYANGMYDVEDVAITLNANTSEQILGFNFVHETIEAINALCDLGMDHTQISTLGMNLYGAFASGKVDFSPTEVQQQELLAA